MYQDGSSPTLTCLHEAPIVAHTMRGEGFDAGEDGTGRGTPLVPVSARTFICAGCGKTISEAWGWGEWCDYCGHEHAQPIAFSCKDHGADASADLAPTLRAMGSTDGRPNGGGQVAVAFHCDAQADQLPGPETDTSIPAALTCSQRVAVAFQGGSQQDSITTEDGIAPTLAFASGTHGGTHQPKLLTPAMSVRRLTPRECERLQGFPDDYTLIPWRKKPAADCPDGPRYKALGNSWAVPCVRWIGARIDAQLRGDR